MNPNTPGTFSEKDYCRVTLPIHGIQMKISIVDWLFTEKFLRYRKNGRMYFWKFEGADSIVKFLLTAYRLGSTGEHIPVSGLSYLQRF